MNIDDEKFEKELEEFNKELDQLFKEDEEFMESLQKQKEEMERRENALVKYIYEFNFELGRIHVHVLKYENDEQLEKFMSQYTDENYCKQFVYSDTEMRLDSALEQEEIRIWEELDE